MASTDADALRVEPWVADSPARVERSFISPGPLFRRASAIWVPVAFGEQILDIADNSADDWQYNEKTGKLSVKEELVLRSKIRIEARQFHMARLRPQQWGERQRRDRKAHMMLKSRPPQTIEVWPGNSLAYRARQTAPRRRLMRLATGAACLMGYWRSDGLAKGRRGTRCTGFLAHRENSSATRHIFPGLCRAIHTHSADQNLARQTKFSLGASAQRPIR